MATRMSMMQKMIRILKIAKKPKWDEVWLIIKITFVGVLVLGITGFLIRMTITALQLNK